MPNITGTGRLPDNSGPLVGAWRLGIYSSNGVGFPAAAGTFLAQTVAKNVDQTGALSWTGLEATTDDWWYYAIFEPTDKRQHKLGPYVFELTANKTWADIIETPSLVPITPAEVTLAVAAQAAAEAARDLAQSARDDAEDARDAALAVPTTTDTLMKGVDANSASQFRVQQDARVSASIYTSRVATMNLRKEVTPSGSNDTAAVNTALAAFAAAGGGKIIWPRDNWKFTGATGLSLTGTSNPIHFELEDDLDLDMTGLTSSATTGLLLGGSATATAAALGADASKGAETITCATVAAAVVAGDIIRIKSTDLFETLSNQPKGEFAEVLSVSGSVITLKGGLYDGYTAATTTVTLMQMPRVTIEGEARLRRNTNNQGLQIAFARDVTIGGLYAEGARERLFYLQHCYGATVDNAKGRDFWYSGTGTSYGLVYAATQHLKVIGPDLRGGRHAASGGGLLPCRDIQFIGGTFDNYHASAQKSFDFHGDCEHVRIVGATILNGLNSQASNLHVGGGTRIRSVAAIPAVEIGPARSCDYVKFENVDIESASGQDGIDYISRNGSNATTLGLLKIDATVRAGAACVSLFPSTSASTGATIDRLHVRGDMQSGGTSSVVSILLSTAAYVGVNDATFEPAPRFYSPGATVMGLFATSTGRARFRGGRFSAAAATGQPIRCEMFGDVAVSDTELHATTGFTNKFFNTGVLAMSNVLIDGASSVGGLNATGPSEALVSNVRRVNTTGNPTLPARHYSRIDDSGNVYTSGTAAPTSGTWVQGDYCKNKPSTVGQPKGWFCTVAGTPGTWVSEGNL